VIDDFAECPAPRFSNGLESTVPFHRVT